MPAKFLFVCHKCKKTDGMRVRVDLYVDMPVKYYRRMSKQAIRSKDILLEGANWPKAHIYCSKCGWSMLMER